MLFCACERAFKGRPRTGGPHLQRLGCTRVLCASRRAPQLHCSCSVRERGHARAHTHEHWLPAACPTSRGRVVGRSHVHAAVGGAVLRALCELPPSAPVPQVCRGASVLLGLAVAPARGTRPAILLPRRYLACMRATHNRLLASIECHALMNVWKFENQNVASFGLTGMQPRDAGRREKVGRTGPGRPAEDSPPGCLGLSCRGTALFSFLRERLGVGLLPVSHGY